MSLLNDINNSETFLKNQDDIVGSSSKQKEITSPYSSISKASESNSSKCKKGFSNVLLKNLNSQSSINSSSNCSMIIHIRKHSLSTDTSEKELPLLMDLGHNSSVALMEVKDKYDDHSPKLVCSLTNTQLIDSLSRIIYKIVDADEPSRKTVFDNEKIPKIGIKDYLSRIFKYCKVSKPTFVMALVLIDRLPDNFIISNYNIHKLLLTCLLISSKIHEEMIHSNYYFSRVGGVNLYEMNTLEIDLLQLLQYNIYINEEEYSDYKDYVFENVEKFKDKYYK